MPEQQHIVAGVAALAAVVALGLVWRQATKAKQPDNRTLYEKVGGDAAVTALVQKFYNEHVLQDPKVNHWFKGTNMATQAKKQMSFISFVLGKPEHKYSGLSMDAAHRKLVEQGMDDSDFDAIAGHLQASMEELNVDRALIKEIMTAVGGMRDQVLCRGKWAKDTRTLYEKVGGEPAVTALVQKFYNEKVLKDPSINHWFKNTNMATQAKKQMSFISYVLGKPEHKYSGLSMDAAHRKLVQQGMGDADFDAVAKHLQASMEELNVDRALIKEIMGAVGGMRDQVLCRGKWA